MVYQRPSVLGVATGAVAGLATITPAAGYVQPIIGIPIGIAASLIGFYCMAFRAKKTRIDESLDVWAVHGMGGTFGTLAVGFFASLAVNPAGRNGLFYGHGAQVLIQLAGIAAVWAFAFAMTWGIGQTGGHYHGLKSKPDRRKCGVGYLSTWGESLWRPFEMKKIEAIIREEKLEPVKCCWKTLGYHGMTITEVSGRGRQKGIPLKWGSKEYRLDFLPKLKIEVVVMDEDVSPAVNAIVRGAQDR